MDFEYIVRCAIKKNDKAYIIATGCYAQYNPEKVSNIKGVSLVLGNKDKFNIIDFINIKNEKKRKINVSNNNECFFPSFSIGNRTRSFLKIQDGCNYKCSYCIIPMSRGISRSDNINNILSNIFYLFKNEVKEIVLTGINLGDFKNRNNSGNVDTFFKLLKTIEYFLSKIINEEENKRIRLSSIEPNLLEDEIIEFLSKSKYFAPHFHIPLQSGSNYILGKMHRRYKKELYEYKVNKIRNIIPNAYIGSDIIVGFPGETYKDFLNTYFFIKKLDISSMHIFTYSSRPNTKSLIFCKKLSNSIKKKRNNILRNMSKKKYFIFCKKQINTKKIVLFEKNLKYNRYIYGYTENYIRTKIPFSHFPNIENTLQKVILKKIDKDGIVIAKLIK